MMGRWRSGAPLACCPFRDDPELGADPRRNNDFLYGEDDANGFTTPAGSHIRRMNPRDANVPAAVRIHRMIRRGTAYGPMLPPGVHRGRRRGSRADVRVCRSPPGAAVRVRAVGVGERGGVLSRRATIKTPLSGQRTNSFTVPRRPVRRRLQGLPRFRRHAGRRVLLHAGAASLALVGGSKHLTPPFGTGNARGALC